MNLYLVQIGPKDAPRLSFGVYAGSKEEAVSQNACLALDDKEEVSAVLHGQEPFPIAAERNALEAARLRSDLDFMNGRDARDRRRLAETASMERRYADRLGWLV